MAFAATAFDQTAFSPAAFDFNVVAGESADLTGSILGLVREAQLVANAYQIVLTLTGTTWAATGATFDAQRQNIINGLTSDRSEAGGWNAQVRDALAVTAVTRTSDTVVTIDIPATAGYDITIAETVTAIVPASAIAGTDPLTAGSFSIGVDLVSGAGNIAFNPGNDPTQQCGRTPVQTASRTL